MQVSSKKSSFIPSYLYSNRGIYYYRACIPKRYLSTLSQRYVRVSLKTGYKKQAIIMALKIHENFVDLLDLAFQLGPNLTDEEKIARLRDDVKKFVTELLNEQNKKPISIKDARLRLNGYLKHELDVDSEDTTFIDFSHTIKNEKGEWVTKDEPTEDVLDKVYDNILNDLKTYENEEIWFNNGLHEIVNREIFDREEIDSNNALPIARLFLKTQALFCKALAEKYRGNLDEEQKIYATECIDYPRDKHNKSNHEISEKNEKQRTLKKQKKPTLLLSELIEKYCSTQMADKKWRPNMLVEHKGRVLNIIDMRTLRGKKAIK